MMNVLPGMNKANSRRLQYQLISYWQKTQVVGKKKDKLRYRSVIEIPTYRVSSMNPELGYVKYQCVRLCDDLKLCHKQAVNDVTRYLST